jgi:hypothetical protein
VREFTANDLVAFATVFGLSVSFFLTPPPGVDSIAAPGAAASVTRSELADVAGSPPLEKIRALEVAHVAALQATGIKAQLARSAPARKSSRRSGRRTAGKG